MGIEAPRNRFRAGGDRIGNKMLEYCKRCRKYSYFRVGMLILYRLRSQVFGE